MRPASLLLLISGCVWNVSCFSLPSVSNTDSTDDPVLISLSGEEPYQTPGWFDVGVGLGTTFNTSTGNDNDVLGALVSVKAYPGGRWYTRDVQGRLRVFRERTSLRDRVSLFYGVSIGEFTGSHIRGSTVHVLGAGVDVSPQLSFVTGVGFFEEEKPGPNDTDFGLYVGFAFNLNALRKPNRGSTFGDPASWPEQQERRAVTFSQ